MRSILSRFLFSQVGLEKIQWCATAQTVSHCDAYLRPRQTARIQPRFPWARSPRRQHVASLIQYIQYIQYIHSIELLVGLLDKASKCTPEFSPKKASTMATAFCRSQGAVRSWTRQAYACRRPLATTRYFSASHASRIRTADMDESDLRALKVDQTRLMDTLHHTCGFGTGHRWGRQALRPSRL